MRILVLLAFFVSGFTSLVLETLWVRMLTLVFGGTTLAIVTVLTAFMGGLALGSLVAGRYTERLKRHVMVYGILEICVAGYALLLPLLLAQLPHIYRLMPMDWPFVWTALVRFVICVLLLLVPTTLMGATLPVLSHFFVRRRTLISFDVGLLYSINTFGAVTGTFLGGFVLLPGLGHSATLYSVASFLLVIALLMVWMGNQMSIDDTDTAPPPETNNEEDIADFSSEFGQKMTPEEAQKMRRVAVVCIAVTGAAAMICQVIWSRTLAMVIGSSTYAFTLILTVFLVGLAGGALWGSWAARRSWDLATSWAAFLLGTGLSVALGSFFMDRLPLLFVSFVYGLPKHTTPSALFAIKAAVAAVPIIIPTLLMGAFFPLALGLYNQEEGAVGESVGQLYAANTFGSIIGSASTGFLIIPLLSLRGGLALCVTLYCLCAVWVVLQRKAEHRMLFAIVGIFGSICIWMLPSWHSGRMSLGTFRLSMMRNSAFKHVIQPGRVVFYKEGVSATVAVEGDDSYRALKVNGKTDASNIGDRSTQIGVSLLPMAIHGKAKDVGIVGWGSGMSVGTALQFPIKHATAVELEPAVVAASYLFRPWNFAPLKDKRLTLYYNDGRNYLATTQKQFDIIVSVPSNPWMSGVANLFTTNYFNITKKRLKPDGIFCQWVQIYELSRRNILSILRSIRSEYPHVLMFEIDLDSFDTLLMASKAPIHISIEKITKLLQKPRYKKLIGPMKMRDAFDYLPRFLLGEKELDKLFQNTKHKIPLNTDDHNKLEFTAPLDLVTQSNSDAGELFRNSIAADRGNITHYSSMKGLQKGKDPAKIKHPTEYWLGMIRAGLRYGAIKKAVTLLKKRKPTDSKHPKWAQLARLAKLMDGKEKPPLLSAAPKPQTKQEKKLFDLLNAARKAYNDDKDEKCIYLLADPETEPAFIKKYPHVLYYMGACSRYSDDYFDAMKYYARYIEHPDIKGKWSYQGHTKRLPPQKRAAPASQPSKRPTSLPTSQPTSRPSPQPSSRPITP